MNKDQNTIVGIFLVLMLGTLIGLSIATYFEKVYWQEQIIKHGYGEYNPVTSEWQWKVDPEKSDSSVEN